MAFYNLFRNFAESETQKNRNFAESKTQQNEANASKGNNYNGKYNINSLYNSIVEDGRFLEYSDTLKINNKKIEFTFEGKNPKSIELDSKGRVVKECTKKVEDGEHETVDIKVIIQLYSLGEVNGCYIIDISTTTVENIPQKIFNRSLLYRPKKKTNVEENQDTTSGETKTPSKDESYFTTLEYILHTLIKLLEPLQCELKCQLKRACIEEEN